jgi:acyl carrier protein
MNEIQKKLIEITSKALNVEEDKITLESDFVRDLGADSLDRVELVMAIEAAFKIEIPEDDSSTILTINDAIKYVEKKSQSENSTNQVENE